MAAAKKLRVLCLHGFRTNDKVMQTQTRALRQALGDRAEFSFLNGPFETPGPVDASIERMHGNDGPFYKWVEVKRLNRELVDEAAHTASLTSPNRDWRFEYVGLDHMVEYVDEYLHLHGPFDAVLGFSMGAAVLTSLSMMYLERDIRWWNLCVCVGGVRVRGVSMRPYFEKPDGSGPKLVPFPSIHIIGKNDPLYSESIKLAEMYEDDPEGATIPKKVFEHDGGHSFPSAKHNPGLYENLAELMVQHCHMTKSVSKI
uniref:Serine hydrolase domain-containing protein n=1 Tax=Globisporangium ultimum (strain ATCC 200006 / CBS 805.95 / DAOM BR144) TaxID=431595 RepID=K3WU27_GLOUD